MQGFLSGQCRTGAGQKQPTNQNRALPPPPPSTPTHPPTLRALVSDSTSSISTNTSAPSSSTSSVIFEKSFDTSLPLSLNHFEKRLWALTSTSCPCVYLSRGVVVQREGEGEGVAWRSRRALAKASCSHFVHHDAVLLIQSTIATRYTTRYAVPRRAAAATESPTHLCPSRIVSFCASALHSDVLPVPGGPCSSTTRFHAIRLLSTPASLKSSALEAYCSRRDLMPVS